MLPSGWRYGAVPLSAQAMIMAPGASVRRSVSAHQDFAVHNQAGVKDLLLSISH